MKVQIAIDGRIEEMMVFDASADYVTVVRHGKVVRECNAALAKAYRRKKKRSNRYRARWPKALPNGVHAKKLSIRENNVSRGSVPPKAVIDADINCSCRNCIWQVAQECVGGKAICESYKPSPRNVEYYQ